MPPVISLPQELKDRYKISTVHEVFSGGQKYVFLVTCKLGNCAIKMFRYGFGEREQREIEFYMQNKLLVGIPRTIEVDTYRGETIVIEEWIKGDPLLNIYLSYKGDSVRISQMITGIADIMDPIWQEGKVHRDLKPQNIIVKPDGIPVVIDFGIFKDPQQTTITDTGFQPHSWAYGAPEQLLGNKKYISYRTDFFSLGVIAYVLYYGELPFGQNEGDVMKKMANSDLTYKTESDCKLNSFFGSTLQFDASARPRNVKIFKEVVKA